MIYAIRIDSDIDDRVKEFNAKLAHDMKIVSMTNSEQYLFLTVEKKEKNSQITNLLMDEYKRGIKNK